MKPSLTFLLLLFIPVNIHAQDPLIKPFLESWKITDTSQTHKAQVIYDHLSRHKNEQEYLRVLSKMNKYLREKPDKRVEARLIEYMTLGAMEFGYKRALYIKPMQKAIKIATALEDKQLLAEIYSLYAELFSYNDYNYVLYNIKAIELQKQTGFSHFPYVHNRFFSVSSALYRSKDYRQSIAYGKACLKFKNTDLLHWDARVYIFQLDILGAAYKKTGAYDSCRYYYQQILDTLSAKPDPDARVQKLWMGIAKGNIGHSLALQGKYEDAIPLIKEYLENSIFFGDPLNISLAEQALAFVYFKKKDFPKAINLWKKAHLSFKEFGLWDNCMEVCKSLGDAYRLKRDHKMAFYYYDLYHQHKDSLNILLDNNRLSALKAKIAFDDLLISLDQKEIKLARERKIRNSIIAGFLLLIPVSFFLNRNYRLREKRKQSLIKVRQEMAEAEAKKAREKITAVTHHLMEKDSQLKWMENQINTARCRQQIAREGLLKFNLLTDESWEQFRLDFSKAYPDYLYNLHQLHLQITPAEERLATLIYLGLNDHEISCRLGISKESVGRSKRRFKHHLNISEATSLAQYLKELSEKKAK